MPWTASTFRSRHWRKAGKAEAAKAADIANAIISRDDWDGDEGKAIATAIGTARRMGRKKGARGHPGRGGRGACGGVRRRDGSGGGVGNR